MFERWSIAAYLYLRGHRLDEKVFERFILRYIYVRAVIMKI